MGERIKRLAIWWLGWAFIVLGILGLFLPILQGILFLLIGLSLLSNSSPWAARLLGKARERFPKISKTYDEAMVKAREMQARLFNKKKSAARDLE
ncbi:MAG TPA: PGPGW domain-containing protein [Blastocatellia bacterium]